MVLNDIQRFIVRLLNKVDIIFRVWSTRCEEPKSALRSNGKDPSRVPGEFGHSQLEKSHGVGNCDPKQLFRLFSPRSASGSFSLHKFI